MSQVLLSSPLPDFVLNETTVELTGRINRGDHDALLHAPCTVRKLGHGL
jgi:hypothetical protein